MCFYDFYQNHEGAKDTKNRSRVSREADEKSSSFLRALRAFVVRFVLNASL